MVAIQSERWTPLRGNPDKLSNQHSRDRTIPHQPDVSVIIPAYNAAWCITDALDSVRRQTFTNFELIVVNDGSPDNTEEVVESYLSHYELSQARIITQPNRGLGGARNAGIRNAKAAFVAFLDQDDVWYPEKLEVVLGTFQTLDNDIGLVCHDERVVKNHEAIRINRYGPWVPKMYEQLLFGDNCLSPGAVTVRRSLLLEVDGFSEEPSFHFVEDYDLWLRLSRLTRFHFTPRVLADYRLFDNNFSYAIEYNTENLLSVLDHHFGLYYSGRAPRLADRFRIRRRKSLVFRRAARGYQVRGEFNSARRHLRRAITLYPFSAKAWALAGLTLGRMRL